MRLVFIEVKLIGDTSDFKLTEIEELYFIIL